MPTPNATAILTAAIFAMALSGCGGAGSSGPSDADAAAAIEANLNQVTYTWPVWVGTICPPARLAHTYDGVPDATVTITGKVMPNGNRCLNVTWSKSETITPVTPGYPLDGSQILLGHYHVDKTGAPVATANGTYSVPFNATFVYTPAGKGLADKGVVAGQSATRSAPQPSVSMSANLAKDADGHWKVQQ